LRENDNNNKGLSHVMSSQFVLALAFLFLIISSSVFPMVVVSHHQQNEKTLLFSGPALAQAQKHIQNNSINSSSNISSFPSLPYPVKTRTSGMSDMAITNSDLSLDSVYTVWELQELGIFYKRNTLSFDPTVSLNSGSGNKIWFPAIAASGNNVHVVWMDDELSGDIMYRKSTDGGADFGFFTINLSNNAGNSVFPSIAASGNNVYVVWMDNTQGNYQILFKWSTDGGASFGGAISLGNAGGYASPLSIAASGNNVYVVWSAPPSQQPNANPEIYFKRSTNGGASFIFSTPNLSLNSGVSMMPAIAASGNNVYVVWSDSTQGNYQILFKRSTNGGPGFGGAINISNGVGGGFFPDIAAIENIT
jgi:hypothetical protein